MINIKIKLELTEAQQEFLNLGNTYYDGDNTHYFLPFVFSKDSKGDFEMNLIENTPKSVIDRLY